MERFQSVFLSKPPSVHPGHCCLRVALGFIFASLTLLNATVQAQPVENFCYPDAIGAPGELWTQAPNWVSGGTTPQRTEFDDPRWNGSMRFSFADTGFSGGGDVSEATIRGLVKDGFDFSPYTLL